MTWKFALAMGAIAASVGCGTDEPSPAPKEDASPDTAGDAGVATCELPVCSGKVTVEVGTTIPRGDSCGNTCSCKARAGGLVSASCSLQPTDNCVCLDAGPD